MENLIDSVVAEESEDDLIDEAMLGMGEFFSQMADVEGYLLDAEMLAAMQMEKVKMSMPMQLQVHVKEDGSVVLGGSPPLYYAATTILPVFHQLTINIKAEAKANQEDDGIRK